jgi:hypothetical protein
LNALRMCEKTGTGLHVWLQISVGGSVPVLFSSMLAAVVFGACFPPSLSYKIQGIDCKPSIKIKNG